MTQQLAEIDRIANDPAAPTFENTIAAMERTGRTLDRVGTVYGIYSSTLNDESAWQAVAARDGAKAGRVQRPDHTERAAVRARRQKVYETRETAGLTPEQQRLTWVHAPTSCAPAPSWMRQGKRAHGRDQPGARQAVHPAFGQNVLKDENDGRDLPRQESPILPGWPQGVRDGMAQGAEGRGQKGKCRPIANTRSSIEPFLTYSDNRALREQAWRMFVNRGDNGGATDNNATIAQILQLRAERAQLCRLPDARALAP